MNVTVSCICGWRYDVAVAVVDALSDQLGNRLRGGLILVTKFRYTTSFDLVLRIMTVGILMVLYHMYLLVDVNWKSKVLDMSEGC